MATTSAATEAIPFATTAMVAMILGFVFGVASAPAVEQSRQMTNDSWQPHIDMLMSSYSEIDVGPYRLDVELYIRRKFLPPVVAGAASLSNLTLIDLNCGFDVDVFIDENVTVIRGFNYTRCPQGRILVLLCLPVGGHDGALSERSQLEQFFFVMTEKLLNDDFHPTTPQSLQQSDDETRNNKLSFDPPRSKDAMHCNIKKQNLVMVGRRKDAMLLPKTSSLLCRFVNVLMVTVEPSPTTLTFNRRIGCIDEDVKTRDIGYGFFLAANCRQLEADEIDPTSFVWYDEQSDKFGPKGDYSTKLSDFTWNVEEQHHFAHLLYFNKQNRSKEAKEITLKFKTMLSTSYMSNKQALIGVLSASAMHATAITPPANPTHRLIRQMFASMMASILLGLAIMVAIVLSVRHTRSLAKVIYYTFYLMASLYVGVPTEIFTRGKVALFAIFLLSWWFQAMSIMSAFIRSEVTASMHSLPDSRLKEVKSCQELSEYLPFAQFVELETGLSQNGGKNTRNSTWLTSHWKDYTRSTVKEIGYVLDRWCLAGLMMFQDRAVCGGSWRLRHIERKLDPYFNMHEVSTPSSPEIRHVVFSNIRAIVAESTNAVSVNYVDNAQRMAFEALRGGLYVREGTRSGYFVFDGGNISTILKPKNPRAHGSINEFIGPAVIFSGGTIFSIIFFLIEICLNLDCWSETFKAQRSNIKLEWWSVSAKLRRDRTHSPAILPGERQVQISYNRRFGNYVPHRVLCNEIPGNSYMRELNDVHEDPWNEILRPHLQWQWWTVTPRHRL